MGKYNDLLIEFMKKKNALVKKSTGLVLTRVCDIAEILSWPDHQCKSALHSMYIDGNEDSCICPWCITSPGCCSCEYGYRNGICSHIKSRYRKIINRLWDRSIAGIIKIPGMISMYEKMKFELRSLK